MIQVFDNLLPADFADDIEKRLSHEDMPWYLISNTVYPGHKAYTESGYKDINFMGHLFILNGQVTSDFHIQMLFDMVNCFKEATNLISKNLYRIRANITFPTPDPQLPSRRHVDSDTPHQVLLYYVNDSDGDTLLYENDVLVNTVSPKKNRFVLFDGHHEHCFYSPVKTDKRIVININLKPKE